MRGVTQRGGERIPGRLRGGHGAVDRERVWGRLGGVVLSRPQLPVGDLALPVRDRGEFWWAVGTRYPSSEG